MFLSKVNFVLEGNFPQITSAFSSMSLVNTVKILPHVMHDFCCLKVMTRAESIPATVSWDFRCEQNLSARMSNQNINVAHTTTHRKHQM